MEPSQAPGPRRRTAGDPRMPESRPGGGADLGPFGAVADAFAGARAGHAGARREPAPAERPTGGARTGPRSPTRPEAEPEPADRSRAGARAWAGARAPATARAGPGRGTPTPSTPPRRSPGPSPSWSPPPCAPPGSGWPSPSPARASSRSSTPSTAAGIRVVATRHEGAAAFAAEAYGQLTGRPAVCLGTRAVGAANLAIGIHTATADSTPMFVLVGQVERGLRGREAFQEVDLVGTHRRPRQVGGRDRRPATAAATLEAAVRATARGPAGPRADRAPGGRPGAPDPRRARGRRSCGRTRRRRRRRTSARSSTSSPRRSGR